MFPYERKIVDEVLSSVPKNGIEPHVLIGHREVENYLAVYSSEYRCFIGISCKRFFSGNYASGVIIDGIRYINRITRLHSMNERGFPRLKPGNLVVYGMEEYLKDNPDDGYEDYLNFVEDNNYNRLAYAMVYLKAPIVREIVSIGNGNLVRNFMPGSFSNERETSGILKTGFSASGLSADLIDFLVENDCYKKTYDSVIRIMELCHPSEDLLKQFIERCGGDLADILFLLERYPDVYTVDSLFRYLERCEVYQGESNWKNTVSSLKIVLELSESLGMEKVYYPGDLARRRMQLMYCKESIDDAISTRRNREVMRLKGLANARCIHGDERYFIRPECDYDHLLKIGRYFSHGFDHPSKNWYVENDFYWLYDAGNGLELALVRVVKGKLKRMTRYDEAEPDKEMERFVKDWLRSCRSMMRAEAS